MRSFCIVFFLVFSATMTAHAQNTYPWPATGNIGIGITPAAARLHIFSDRQEIKFATGTNTSSYALSIGVNDDGVNFTNNSSSRGFNFGNQNGQMLSISSFGNIGIGTTPGTLRLDVNGITRSTGSVVFFGPGTAADNASTIKRGLYVDNGASTSWELLSLQNSSGTQFKVLGNGNVGIGTANPKGYKLAVEGTIAGRRVKVTQESWADFVFNNDYDLPSLQYVESCIQKNKHLPDIPSAAQVKAEGIDVGDMNKRLLQKVEELTLYIIELNKKVEAQGKVIAEMSPVKQN